MSQQPLADEMCPTRPDIYDLLDNYALEKTTPEQNRMIEEHLDECPFCREDLEITFHFTPAVKAYFRKKIAENN